MAKSKQFFERVITAVYTRRAADILPLKMIQDEARYVLSPSEIENGLMPVFQEMVEIGRLEMVDSRKTMYKLHLF